MCFREFGVALERLLVGSPGFSNTASLLEDLTQSQVGFAGGRFGNISDRVGELNLGQPLLRSGSLGVDLQRLQVARARLGVIPDLAIQPA